MSGPFAREYISCSTFLGRSGSSRSNPLRVLKIFNVQHCHSRLLLRILQRLVAPLAASGVRAVKRSHARVSLAVSGVALPLPYGLREMVGIEHDWFNGWSCRTAK